MNNILRLVSTFTLASIIMFEDVSAQQTSIRTRSDTTSVTTPSRESTSGRRSTSSGRRSTDEPDRGTTRATSSGRSQRDGESRSGRTRRGSEATSGRSSQSAKTASDISGEYYGPYIFFSDLTDAHTVVDNACSWSKFQTPSSPYKFHKRVRGYGSLNGAKTSCSGKTKRGRSQTKTSGFYILVADNLDAAGYKLGSSGVFEEIEAAASTSVLGCMDPSADNYNSEATEDDGSCTYQVNGCTDPLADNYDVTATVDDGTCMYTISGCTDPSADNYNSEATVDDGTCTYPILGCTNPCAENFNNDATQDDGTCTRSPLTGSNKIINIDGYNTYGPYVLVEDLTDEHVVMTYSGQKICSWSLFQTYNRSFLDDRVRGFGVYDGSGCSGQSRRGANQTKTSGYYVLVQSNLDAAAYALRTTGWNQTTSSFEVFQQSTSDFLDCDVVVGCMNPTASNYNSFATVDDGSCLIDGCTNSTATNYEPTATVNDGSCIINGCMSSCAANYNSVATIDDGSCVHSSVVDISYASGGSIRTLPSSSQYMYQSFTAGKTGTLNKIILKSWTTMHNDFDINYEIRQGDGISGTLLHSGTVTVKDDKDPTQDFDRQRTLNLGSAMTVTAGQQYSFIMRYASGNYQQHGFEIRDPGSYSGGQFVHSAYCDGLPSCDKDLWFKTMVTEPFDGCD